MWLKSLLVFPHLKLTVLNVTMDISFVKLTGPECSTTDIAYIYTLMTPSLRHSNEILLVLPSCEAGLRRLYLWQFFMPDHLCVTGEPTQAILTTVISEFFS